MGGGGGGGAMSTLTFEIAEIEDTLIFRTQLLLSSHIDSIFSTVCVIHGIGGSRIANQGAGHLPGGAIRTRGAPILTT